jgi:Zn-dependent M28 family amino/carboxypeptidase
MKSFLILFILTTFVSSFNVFRNNSFRKPVVKPEELREKFKEAGLKPIEKLGGYIQDYSYTARQKSIEERNVVGFLEGTDPALKDEYIIISAHFDHIGISKAVGNDSICNGADDNAAGTCTLLGIARTIKVLDLKPGRSIIFCAFSGEENGMRGSRYFVANPPLPLINAYADLNFEMTGHSEYLGKNKYYMTGCSNSTLDNLIGEYNKKSDWQLVDTIAIANNLFFASDNIAFSRISVNNGVTQGIPSGTFATTTLADYLHTPSDEVKYFDFNNMSALVSYFSDLVIWLSNSKSEIIWSDPKFTRLR